MYKALVSDTLNRGKGGKKRKNLKKLKKREEKETERVKDQNFVELKIHRGECRNKLESNQKSSKI